jgi:hypothetical protein
VAEDDGLSFAPVLVVDLRSVFRGDCARCIASTVCRLDGGHSFASCSIGGCTDVVARFTNNSLYRYFVLFTSLPSGSLLM